MPTVEPRNNTATRESRRRRFPRIGPAQKAPKRRDIQGLRALAVLLVFADHMLGWPAGGFIGVDVFFVISGYLITGLLLRQYLDGGRIAFVGFYTARAKRIMPAAITVMICVVALAFISFTRQRAIATTSDAAWAFVFGANWNLVAAQTDYFQQGTAVSPLQHYWSLSVEEQFYAVWPWLLLGLLLLFTRVRTLAEGHVRWIAGTTIGAICTTSFGWALYQSATQPTVAYFSTLTRGWELGAGAAVAIAVPFFAQLPNSVRTVVAYSGLTGILASALLISDASPWPAPTALFPVLATAAVLASGVSHEIAHFGPLQSPAAVFIGDISYSLYLWHFPVVVFAHVLYPDAGVWVYLGIAAGGFILATAQYYAIELPIWKSPLWTGKQRRSDLWRQWKLTYGDRAKLAALVGFATIAVGLIGVVFVPEPPVAYIPPPSTTPGTAVPSGSAPGSPNVEPAPTDAAVVEARQDVSDALSASVWPPSLTPSIDTVGAASKVRAWTSDDCLAFDSPDEVNPDLIGGRCSYGESDSADRVLVVGDSVAISWVPAVQTAFPAAYVTVLTMRECPFAEVTVRKNDQSAFPACDEFHALVREILGEMKPTMIILAQAENSADRVTGEVSLDEGLDRTLSIARAESERVVTLSAPPVGKIITECYRPNGRPSDCVSEMSTRAHAAAEALRSAAIRSGTSFIDTSILMCQQSRCPAVIGGYIVTVDGTHLTQDFSERLGTPLKELMGSL